MVHTGMHYLCVRCRRAHNRVLVNISYMSHVFMNSYSEAVSNRRRIQEYDPVFDDGVVLSLTNGNAFYIVSKLYSKTALNYKAALRLGLHLHNLLCPLIRWMKITNVD